MAPVTATDNGTQEEGIQSKKRRMDTPGIEQPSSTQTTQTNRDEVVDQPAQIMLLSDCECRVLSKQAQMRLVQRLHKSYPDVSLGANPLYYWLSGIREYERFLMLAVAIGQNYAPMFYRSESIERIWRMHLIDTRCYQKTIHTMAEDDWEYEFVLHHDPDLDEPRRSLRYRFLFENLKTDACQHLSEWWPKPSDTIMTTYPYSGSVNIDHDQLIKIVVKDEADWVISLEVPISGTLETIMQEYRHYTGNEQDDIDLKCDRCPLEDNKSLSELGLQDGDVILSIC